MTLQILQWHYLAFVEIIQSLIMILCRWQCSLCSRIQKNGPEIIQKIKKVYQNIETQFKVNEHLSQTFLEKRGLLQECPLSMILCTIFAEIILENIRQNSGIKGIVIGGKELKTSGFDDYVTIYIGSNSSLHTSRNATNAFWKSHWHQV